MDGLKEWRYRIALLALLLTMSGCTQAAFTAANLPTRLVEMAVERDRAYGPDPSHKLDIYVPANAEAKQLDVIVFFYGGRWTYGAKEDYRFVGATFVDKGFIVVIPDYRKYPQVRFPRFVQDGAKALAWVSDHIAESHGNPARIHVVGHSAGAHIGALLAADPHYLADEGKHRSLVIHDFAGLAGPYAFTPDEPDLEDMFGPPQNYPHMQVTTFIDGTQPPMLLLYGNRDTAVKLANLEKLEGRITQRGGCVRARIYPDTDHTDLIGALSWWNLQKVPVVEDITAFFDSCH
jgi:acetyl esterase/lipase